MRIPCPRAFQCTENNLPSLRRAGMLLFLEFRPDIVGFSLIFPSISFKESTSSVKGTGKTIVYQMMNIHAGISEESDRFERDALGLMQSRYWFTKDHVILC